MIGVFDSGIGGLTVVKALRQHFPYESFLYLGDTARLPYGSKSPETIRSYVAQNLRFLMHQQVSAVVVACNSASSVLGGAYPLPIYGVIEPGACKAIEVSHTRRIGVIGTNATIRGEAYRKALLKLDPSAQVFSQACPLLVPLVEEGWIDDPLTNQVLLRYLSPLLEQKIDTLILGCTHYPVLRSAIARVVGRDVALVDSASGLIDAIERDHAAGKLARAATGAGRLEICVTDLSPTFQMIAEMILGERGLNLRWVQI